MPNTADRAPKTFGDGLLARLAARLVAGEPA